MIALGTQRGLGWGLGGGPDCTVYISGNPLRSEKKERKKLGQGIRERKVRDFNLIPVIFN